MFVFVDVSKEMVKEYIWLGSSWSTRCIGKCSIPCCIVLLN